MTPTGPMFFYKLLLNGASHDIEIGFISLICAGAKKYKFSFCYAQDEDTFQSTDRPTDMRAHREVSFQ